MTTAWPSEVLRELLARPAILEQPAVCDPLTARLARDAGYEAVALGRDAIGAHLPLSCDMSLDDIEHAARAAIRACQLPLLLDADIGLVGTGQIAALVARLEAVGVAAIQLSSQHLPDQVPFSRVTERRSAQAELLRRVEAARTARDHALIMARCDVTPDDGYRDALDRARNLLSVGADAILVHAAGDELRRFPHDLPAATLIYTGLPAPGRGPSVFPAELLEQWGYSALSNKYHRCYCSRRPCPVPEADVATCRVRPAARRPAPPARPDRERIP